MPLPSKTFAINSSRSERWGPLKAFLACFPTWAPFKDLNKARVDEKELTRTEAIIDSMTPRERRNHQVINGARRKRIARGSGTSVQQVNQLLKQYIQARKMMKGMTAGFAKGSAGAKGKKGKRGKKGHKMRGLQIPRMPRSPM